MAYLLINEPTPDAMLNERGTSRVEWPSPSTIRMIVADWRHFAGWLAGQQVPAFADVTADQLERYQSLVTARDAGDTQRHRLRSVTRLWAMSTRVAPSDRLVAPPWESEDLQFERAGNENTTPVIHPDVMAPLLRWSMILVQQAAPDILAMITFEQAATDRLPATPGTRSGLAAARTIMNEYQQSGRPLPGHARGPRTVMDSRYLALVHGGCHPNDIGFVCAGTSPALKIDQGTAPLTLPLPVTGQIDGHQWVEHLDYRQLSAYRQALTGACLTVIAYLTGMRPQEVMALRKGCVTSSEVDDRHQYVVHGHKFKRVQRDGRQNPAGEPRT